jgi:hypothetical protein
MTDLEDDDVPADVYDCECCGETYEGDWDNARQTGWICDTLSNGESAILCPDCANGDA